MPVDIDLAEQQWGAYCDALDTWGFETVRVPGDDALPDSVFVEDAVVMFGDLAVLTSPGAETRRAETDAVGDTLRGARRSRWRPSSSPAPSTAAMC